MVSFPNCKINIGLYIKDKRPDGYHNLETVFVPVQLTDALEAVRSNDLSTSLHVTGILLDASTDDNICTKAYQLLKEKFPALPAVKMYLHKAIPSGAGLGGGSADGAFTLRLLNEKFGLGLSQQELIDLALQLGSDCPFFIINKPCLATGRGEVMEPLSLDLSRYSLVLINPGIHINTGWAFRQLKPNRNHPDLKAVIAQPVSIWKDSVYNDFEEPVFDAFPEIKAIKETLYTKGAVYAAMTGSGSTVFGLFEQQYLPEFDFPIEYLVVSTKVL